MQFLTNMIKTEDSNCTHLYIYYEEGMATHPVFLPEDFPWTEVLGRLQFIESQSQT